MTRSVVRGLRAVALTGTLVLATGAAFAEDPIKLGVLEDQSGDFAAATIGKVHAIQLAAEEINKAGGISGRPIELVTYDTQSDNTRYQEFMRRVLQRDKVDVVFAGFSSASREAYRPIVDQFNGFAFYNNQYEGGVCDGHMIVTGAVPEQQFSTLIPYMMENTARTSTRSPPITISARSRRNGSARSSRRPAARWPARSSSRSACRSSPRASRTSRRQNRISW